MPVGYPELHTNQLDDKTWIAECDGFEAIGATESEAIAQVCLNIKNFMKGIEN